MLRHGGLVAVRARDSRGSLRALLLLLLLSDGSGRAAFVNLALSLAGDKSVVSAETFDGSSRRDMERSTHRTSLRFESWSESLMSSFL